MKGLLTDIRYALRSLANSPGFTVVAVLTLALGIGATSTIFSWINSTLLNPIPAVAHTSDLLSITRGERNVNPVPPFSYPDYVDLQESNRSFAGLLAYHDSPVSLTGRGKPERVWADLTSTNYFDVLGLHAVLGRTFLPGANPAQGGTPEVVLSYGLWQRRFGGDASIVGKSLEVNRRLYTVVGVAPPKFQGVKTGTGTDLWIPLSEYGLVFGGDQLESRDSAVLQVLGRLKPGVSPAQAEQEMNAVMRGIVERFPNEHRGPNQISFDPLWRSPFGANVYLYASLPLLLAIAGVVLLLACANVANLLLVRSVARRREVAIRLSMGSSRWRLVRQFLTESLLLAMAAGIVALLATLWTARTFGSFIPKAGSNLTLNGEVDGTVVAVTFLIAAAASVVFGTLPALRASSVAPITVLKDESGGAFGGVHKARLSRWLVVAQISISFFLLICAGLFVRSLQNSRHTDLGFEPDNVLIAMYDLGPVDYTRESGTAFHKQLFTKLQAMPGVESAALSDWIPLNFNKRTNTFAVEGYIPRTDEVMDIRRAIVSPHYFHTMRIPLLEGREFAEQDTRASDHVAIVDRAFADRYWPNQEALGKRINTRGSWYTVVGVAKNSKHLLLNEPPDPILYLPIFQTYSEDAIIHLRVSGAPQAYAAAMENTSHELNPNLPLFAVQSLRESVEFASTLQRVAGTFVGAFGAIALLLAAVGIYGVLAYTMRQRTHEFGIRIALGAQPMSVFKMVLRQGMLMTVYGLVIGIWVSLVLTRLLRRILLGVTALDLATFLAVTVLLTGVAFVACYLPARRAMRVNPVVALHHE